MEEMYDKHFVKNWLKAKDKALQAEHEALDPKPKRPPRPPRPRKVKYVTMALKSGIR